jgi:hypothetical protein
MQKKGGCGCSMKFGGGKRRNKKTMKKRSKRRGGNAHPTNYPLNQNPIVAGTNLSARNNISGGKRKKIRGGMFQTLTNSLINKDPLLGGNHGALLGFGSSGGTQNAINIVSGKTESDSSNMKPLV